MSKINEIKVPDRAPDIILPARSERREIQLYIKENIFYFPKEDEAFKAITSRETRYDNVITYLESWCSVDASDRATDAALALAEIEILDIKY